MYTNRAFVHGCDVPAATACTHLATTDNVLGASAAGVIDLTNAAQNAALYPADKCRLLRPATGNACTTGNALLTGGRVACVAGASPIFRDPVHSCQNLVPLN